MRIEPDLRFTRVQYELWGVEAYLEHLEELIGYIGEQTRVRAKADLEERGREWGDPEVDLALQELSELRERIYPRLFRNGLIVILWSVFELSLEDLARVAARAREVEASYPTTGPGNVLARARRYYNQKLDIRLCPDSNTWRRLQRLRVIRNAIAHANGRASAVRDSDWRKIKQWADEGAGFQVDQGFLTLSPTYLTEVFEMVREVLTRVINELAEAR